MFRQAWHLLRTGQPLPEPSFNDKCRAIVRHLDLLDRYAPGAPAVDCMRKRISWYGKTMGHIKPLKEAIRLASSTDSMRMAVQAWIQPDREGVPRAGFRTPETAF
jgi:tRNA-dihydrouridine synthase